MVFYATILIEEWGEEDREQRIGPFVPMSGLEDDPIAAEEALRANLDERGDRVLFVERA